MSIFWTQRTHQRTESVECASILSRLTSFSALGLISDPLIVSKFHNGNHGPKGKENRLYFESKDYTKEMNVLSVQFY